LPEIERLPQYLPVTPSISWKPRRIGIVAPSTAHENILVQTPTSSSLKYEDLPGFLGGLEPTILPISVETHPGQQELIRNPGFSRARTAVKAFMHALLTL